MERVLVLIRKPPYGTEAAFAGLRCCLALQASGEVRAADVVLLEEGAYNLLAHQQPEAALGMPSNAVVLEELTGLGSRIWAVASDCGEVGLDPQALPYGVEPLEAAGLAGLVATYDGVFSF